MTPNSRERIESHRAYLDHAATTALYPEVIAAYADELGKVGNVSSLHGPGRAARRVVEESREQLAAIYGCRPSEIIFTSGGTEANNLAVKGQFWARRLVDPKRRRIVVSAIEHHAVLDPAFWMAEHSSAEIVLLPVDGEGRVDLAAAAGEIDAHGDEIAVLSVMWANNEVGTIQPIPELAALAHRRDVTLHSDAVQAAGILALDFATSGADALTITAHKIGGPMGVGALIARRDLALTPVLHGGGQERAVRSGTIDAPAIRAFAVAAQISADRRVASAAYMTALRDELIAGVLREVPGAVLRGVPVEGGHDAPSRLPGNAHFTFEGCEGDSLLYLLDSAGISASTGSACQAGVPQASHVLVAMGIDEVTSRGALRFSLGSSSTREDVRQLLEVLPAVVQRAQAAGVTSARPVASSSRRATSDAPAGSPSALISSPAPAVL